MCSCETSFGSIFLLEIGASVDGAPVVIRTSVELSRSIRPKDGWKSKGEHVLGFFKKLL